MKHLLILLSFCFLGQLAHGQDLEKLGGKPLSFSGNISLGSSLYHVDGRENRRSPFAYYISANPTLTIYGLDIPVSFVYRDQQASISNPFNRVSINPTYKWVSVHLGNINLQLNPYSLSGQLIKGAGIDLSPGPFRIMAIAGTLQNPLAQLDTIVEGAQILPSYERNAMGAKIGFGSDRNYFDIIAFKAKDDPNSLDASTVDPRLIKPEDNLVVGSSLKISPFKFFNIYANAAASAHTANQNSGDYFESEDIANIRSQFGSLLELNFSTKLQFAGDAGFNFKFKNFGFGGEYKRVDPLYKSLGTYYFLEDYENLLVKLNLTLFKGKFRFTGRGGLQRNNLSNLRDVTNTRTILNGSLTVAPSKNFSLTGRYSNFQTERSPGLVTVNDTLRFARATEMYGVSPRISFGSKDRRSNITASLNYQNLDDFKNGVSINNTIENYNGSLSYTLSSKARQMSFSLSALGNQNLIKDIERQRIGGSLRITKKLMDTKLSLSLGVGMFQNYLNQVDEGQSITGRVGLRYRIKNSIQVSTQINYLNRSGAVAYQEYRGNVKLTYVMKSKENNNTKEKEKEKEKN